MQIKNTLIGLSLAIFCTPVLLVNAIASDHVSLAALKEEATIRQRARARQNTQAITSLMVKSDDHAYVRYGDYLLAVEAMVFSIEAQCNFSTATTFNEFIARQVECNKNQRDVDILLNETSILVDSLIQKQHVLKYQVN